MNFGQTPFVFDIDGMMSVRDPYVQSFLGRPAELFPGSNTYKVVRPDSSITLCLFRDGEKLGELF